MEHEKNTARNYKDTVFSSLFYECENAVENAKDLYSALTGKTVETAEKCRLEDVLFREFKNDVAYIMDGKLVCFIEHQSTLNPNMPLRLFIYAARTYERNFLTDNLIYSSNLIKIPTPEFYVLYNGRKKLDSDIMKLSTAFKTSEKDPELELIVNVRDINYDRMNGTELARCQTLSDYSFLIEKIREYQGDIERAVKECIDLDILAEYLKFYGSEVINMLFEEYDAKKALDVKGREEFEKGKAEGIAEGKAEGIAEGIAEGKTKGEAALLKKLQKLGNTVKQIAAMFEMPENEVERLLAID